MSRDRSHEHWRRRLLEMKMFKSHLRPAKGSFDLTCPVLVSWMYNGNWRFEIFHPYKRRELISLLKLIHILEWIDLDNSHVVYAVVVAGKGKYRREMYPISSAEMDIYYDAVKDKDEAHEEIT